MQSRKPNFSPESGMQTKTQDYIWALGRQNHAFCSGSGEGGVAVFMIWVGNTAMFCISRTRREKNNAKELRLNSYMDRKGCAFFFFYSC